VHRSSVPGCTIRRAHEGKLQALNADLPAPPHIGFLNCSVAAFHILVTCSDVCHARKNFLNAHDAAHLVQQERLKLRAVFATLAAQHAIKENNVPHKGVDGRLSQLVGQGLCKVNNIF